MSKPVIKCALQSAATTGNGTAINLNGDGRELSFYIEGAGTITGGTVQCEEASSTTFAGTWSPIGSAVTVSTASQVIKVTGAFLAVRARIASEITGDGASVTVTLVGN